MTEKEELQAQADELGLDTEGTIAQLKVAIAAAEATDAEATGDDAPVPSDDDAPPPPTMNGVEASEPSPVMAEEDLPEPPVDPEPVVTAAAAAAASAPEVASAYRVVSAFWMQTSKGDRLAQRGATVHLKSKLAHRFALQIEAI